MNSFLNLLVTVGTLGGFVPSVLADSFPKDVDVKRFSGPDVTPCPACLCVSAQGEVFAGVDLNGSLGKGPGKGQIVKLLDRDQDGVADSHTVFAKIDNVRGIISVGTRLFVLHTAYDKSGKSTGMDLVSLDDANGDGLADGPPTVLVSGICAAASINARGTDHSTNGIRMGIDGWIYIAVGDFGFHDATGTDGTKLTLLGGGIVRVRPNGAEMELYTTGTRNIYDVAIDPFMNCYTRGNTNDGGGWNVRFLHHIQSGEYGYPRLFQNFVSEIIPAIEDLGGGSGVGSLYLSEPTWPENYNNQPLMADWGRKAVFIHRLTPDGPSFTEKVEEMMQVSQVTDLDVDPSGQMFVSAWDGAGFKGDPNKGYILRVTPKDWKSRSLPAFSSYKSPELVQLLASQSATTRLYAQQELLNRPSDSLLAKPSLAAAIRNTSLPLAARVANLFTLAQIETDPNNLLAFASDDALCEFVLRAAADRLPRLKVAAMPLAPFVETLKTGTPRQQAAAAIALGRIGSPAAAPALLQVAFTKPEAGGSGGISQKDTLKNTRESKLEIAVKPGNELRLHLVSTDGKANPVKLAFFNAIFTLANNKSVELASLQPISGNAGLQEPPTAGQPRKGQRKKAAPTGAVVASAPGPVIYQVPPNAILFSATVKLAAGYGAEDSVEFHASTGKAGETGGESTSAPHATPNSPIIVPHLAAHSLMRLNAVDACLGAIGTSSEDLALWALSGLHTDAAADGLLARLKATPDNTLRAKLLTTLARLYQQEAPYDGSWWWTTRPDSHGPYYKPVKWSASPRIGAALEAELVAATPAKLDFLASLNDTHRLGLAKLGSRESKENLEKKPTVDLAKIASQKGAVATTPIEDVILAVDSLPPNPTRGKELFASQGCVACHSLEQGGPSLGPYMGQIGSIMNPAQIATAILRPSDSISQGFQTVTLTMKDGTLKMGYVSESTADNIVLRDATGAVTNVAKADVKDEAHAPNSMMPEGLANSLSLDDFTALVQYLSSKK